MKKKYLYLILALVVIAALTGTFYFTNKENNIGEEKEVQINPIQNYKNNEAYVEQVVNSFFQVYTNLANSKTLDFSYLGDVVDKTSTAHGAIEQEIATLRKNGEEIQIIIMEMNISQKSDTLYEVKVTTDKIISSASDNKPNLENLLITVKAQDGYKIVDFVKQ